MSKTHAAASAERGESEVVLESEHHLARTDLGAGNLTEGRRSEAGVGIAEHWMIEDVLGLDSNLQPLPVSNGDFLTQHGVEDLDRRRAVAERPRRGAGDIRRRL